MPEGGPDRLEGALQDFGSGYFNSGCGFQGRMGAQGCESFEADASGKTHTKAEADPWDEPFVLSAVLEPGMGLFDPLEDEGTGGGGIFPEVCGLEAERLEIVGGQVATAGGQILGQIPENVDELESLAEEPAVFKQGGLVGLGPIREGQGAESGPKFANASGYGIGVGLEVLAGSKGRRMLGAGVPKSGQVEGLGCRDDLQEPLDLAPLVFWQLSQFCQEKL